MKHIFNFFQGLYALICSHEWKAEDHPKYYFYWKCRKCNSSKGIGGFVYKNRLR